MSEILSISQIDKCENNPEKELDIVIDSGDLNIKIYRTHGGEDHSILIEFDNGDKLLGVFDGHGDKNSQYYSYICCTILIERILKKWEDFRELVSENNVDEIKKIIKYLFIYTQNNLKLNKNIKQRKKLDSHIPLKIRHGGTTASIALVINSKSKRVLITANCGDSPIIWSNDSTIKECSLEHNCDNIVAVNEYLSRMKELNKRPKKIMYSRINYPLHGGPIWDSNNDGNPQPIPVFDYIDDKAVLIKDNYNKLSRFYPKGIQTRRYPPTEIVNGAEKVLSGHEAENWGSTLEGEVQLLKSFGDFYLKKDICCVPHITINEINESGLLMVASDGFTDLYSIKEWVDFLKKLDLSDPLSVKEIKSKIFNIFSIDKEYGFKYKGDTPHPIWDDVSLVVVKLDSK